MVEQACKPWCRAAQRAAAVAAEADARYADLIETPERKRHRLEAAGKANKRVTFASDGLEQVWPLMLMLAPPCGNTNA
jgi:hypothetical protein